ncbi:MAG: tetratricopeptide repeat protein, partial [Rhodospirillales bacterium]|nr:tetratricopeptide repeat protein [Rhodospirillales bacterium]
VPHLQKAVELDPENPLAHRRLGELHLQDNRPELAVHAFARTLEFDLESETLHFFLAQALEASGRLTEALNHFIQARELDPGFADAHYRTALLARRQNQPVLAQQAMQAFRRLQQIGNGDANVLKQLNHLRAAAIDYPEEALYHCDLARFFAAHGFASEALNRFKRVLQKRPGDFRTMNDIGNILLEQKKPAAALPYYLKAIAAAPSFPPAHMNAGNAYMLLQQPQRAARAYDQATQLAPQAPMTWYNLARAHLVNGNRAAADSALQRGLERSQPNESMRRTYDKLRRQLARQSYQ